jgi:hypothetical protein
LLAPAGAYMINGNYKTYVKKYIHDDEFLTMIGVVSAIANGCSRYLWNILFNKTGYKTTMLGILSLVIIVCVTIRFTVNMRGLYMFIVFVMNCCVGGFQVTTPTVSQTVYGHKIGSQLYGFFWCCLALSNSISYLFVANLSKKIGFDIIIYICLGMSVVSIPIIIFTKFQGPW